MSEGEKILDGLKLDDLQEQHRQVAEIIGMDNMIKLAENFGGSSFYVPQKRELIKNHTYDAIFTEFDGNNIKKLANKYEVSESTVYNIVREKILKGAERRTAAANIPGQLDFTDIYDF